MPLLPSLRPAALFLLAAAPWLNPFSAGPSAQVQPWLVSMGCALAIWLLCATSGSLPRVRLVWPCIAIPAWVLLSQGALEPEIVFLAGGLALVALGASFADQPGVARTLQLAFLAAACASAVIGLIQYFGVSSLFAPWINTTLPGTAFANLRQTNQYATLSWIGLSVLLFGSLPLAGKGKLCLALLLGVGCAASVSRTGVLELLVLAVLAAWWSGPLRRQRLVVFTASAAAYATAVFLLPLLLEAVTGTASERTLWNRFQGEGCSSRLVLWSNVLHLTSLRPWVGWGWGELDYAHYVTLYGGVRFCDILDNAHNLPLHLAVELGVPAALLVCLGSALWAAKQRPWAETAALRQLAWAMLAIIVLHSLLEYPLWYGPFQLALGACIGWLLLPKSQRDERPRSWPTATFLVLAVAGTAYAAWDYQRVSQIYLSPEPGREAWREETLNRVRHAWLFQGPARFADVTLATVTPSNAAWMYREAGQTLHYSPEPVVIERVIESAVALGRDDEALLHLARYRAAFPQEHAQWRLRQLAPVAPTP